MTINANKERKSEEMNTAVTIITGVYVTIALCVVMLGINTTNVSNTVQTVWEIEPYETDCTTDCITEKVATIRYEMTAAERDTVERVVMAEAGSEPYEGKIAVAQCILNACELRTNVRTK